MRALLFSGGLDSTSLAWRDKPDRLIFIDYGQLPGAGEERASRAIADHLNIPLTVCRADLSAFGSGSLSGRPAKSVSAPEFWPYRNQLLVTLAVMALAEEKLDVLMLGTVITDNVHSDGRPEFIHALKDLIVTQGGPEIIAPAIQLTTEQLVKSAGVPISILGWTFSCHTGPWACGTCRGCTKHSIVMQSALTPTETVQPRGIGPEPIF
jgi:7-cyano-7-deazaguanine synthase